MTKNKPTDDASELDRPLTDQLVQLDYVMLDVRLTVAVESYWCETHQGEATDAAIEAVLDRLTIGDDQTVIVLGAAFERLRVQR